MTEKSVRLIYPPPLISTPIINQLIRRYDLTINIIMAHITLEEGWLEIQMTGDESIIAEAIGWLESQGILVQPAGL